MTSRPWQKPSIHRLCRILDNQRSLLILLTATFGLAPLTHIAAYQANQIAFGESIEDLDQNIIKMEVL